MNIVRHLLTEHGARTDARHGLDSVEDRIVAECGPRPKLDPVANPEHGQLVAALAERVRIEELREDLARVEDELAKHMSPLLLGLGLLAAMAIEVLGALLIMRALQVPSNERLPLGLALAFALIGITAVVAHRTASRADDEKERAKGKTSRGLSWLKRSAWTLIIVVIYTAFVGAITVIRLQSSAEGDGSPLEIIAQALLMLATCLGPAWMAEWLMRRRAPAVAVRKRHRLLARRIKDTERAYRKAQTAINQIARDGARWDLEAARRRALYATTYRLEKAKVISNLP